MAMAVPAPSELPFVQVQPVDATLDAALEASSWPLVDTSHRVLITRTVDDDVYHPCYDVLLADLDGRNTRRARVHCCAFAALLRSRRPAIDAYQCVVDRHARYWYLPFDDCVIL